MSKSVIVFGPTGNVGSITAQTAEGHGAKVYLAMRDTQKKIPGFPSEKEKSGNYVRIQADLSNPESVKDAVQKSGAKSAFIYAIHSVPDHMKASIQALKAGGVDFVVFLSSYTVTDPIKDIPEKELISYQHAQVELNLEEVYGGRDHFVALRAGGFATNSLRWKEGIQQGELELFGADLKLDGITPDDMGRVAGTILVKGSQDGQSTVYLYGPERFSQGDAARKIGEVLDLDVDVMEQTAESAKETYLANGISEDVADYLISIFSSPDAKIAEPTRYEEGVENIKKYTGRAAMKFEDWVRENQDLFV